MIAFVLELGKALIYFFGIDFLPHGQGERHCGVGFNVAQTINARNRCDNDYVTVFQNVAGGRVAHTVNLFVDCRIFFNVGIGFGNVGFRLVIVVVRNKVFHVVVGEKLLHFRVQLSRKDFIGRHNQGRTFALFDDFGHSIGFAAAGHSQQDLVLDTVVNSFAKLLDCLGLVAGRLKRAFNLKIS